MNKVGDCRKVLELLLPFQVKRHAEGREGGDGRAGMWAGSGLAGEWSR